MPVEIVPLRLPEPWQHVFCSIAIDPLRRDDPIMEALANGSFVFPAHYELAFHLLRPGSRVIDAGAHIGTFSLAAAALGCEVIAIEAAPENVTLLQTSTQHNHFDIHIVAAAASDRVGTLSFSPLGPYGFVAPNANVPNTVEVPAITVDAVVDNIPWTRVDLVKMDIEGSELMALRGMQRLLSTRDAPALIYESNGHTLWQFFRESPRNLKSYLKQIGYQNYRIESHQLIPVEDNDIQPEVVVDYFATRMLPTLPSGWQISPRMSTEEIIARVLATCNHPQPIFRQYIARTLAEHPDLVSSPQIATALETLRSDADSGVRAAVDWYISLTSMATPRDGETAASLASSKTGEARMERRGRNLRRLISLLFRGSDNEGG